MQIEKKSTRTRLLIALEEVADPVRAVHAAGYFKTGKGQYGEGDIFLGIPVPVLRKIALLYRDLSLDELQKLLTSKIHEHRAAALEILVVQYKRGDEPKRNEIAKFYLRNTMYINNWDLVDLSARPILGDYLKTHPRRILKKLAISKSMWERRIAIIATMTLVWDGELDDALEIAKMLLDDPLDLIHKAVGWVLREIGRKDRRRLLAFLDTHYSRLPRTTLRYAIEHFTPKERKRMLAGEFASDC